MMATEKDDWVLAALLCGPLDRIRLMEALFLFWHESGRDIPAFFEFEPYLYGPCCFELYDVLSGLESQHLIGRPRHEPLPRAKYHLTPWGRARAERVREGLATETYELLRCKVTLASETELPDLFRKVCRQAPELVKPSVVPV